LITGHNTDVEYDGVTYHVQTEDKGLETPLILSLVYVGGAILASKRSRYDDLIAGGFDEKVLTERLNRQHKLICAAVNAGRIEELKRMSDREPAKSNAQAKPVAEESLTVEKKTPERPVAAPEESSSKNAPAAPDRFPILAAGGHDEFLQVTLMQDRELRGGNFETLRVLVSRQTNDGPKPVINARVVLKTLGTSFRPGAMSATTDGSGVARFAVSLPAFKEGRAAVLVRAEVDGETAELRRIVLPA
jgi:hypothetical protein